MSISSHETLASVHVCLRLIRVEHSRIGERAKFDTAVRAIVFVDLRQRTTSFFLSRSLPTWIIYFAGSCCDFNPVRVQAGNTPDFRRNENTSARDDLYGRVLDPLGKLLRYPHPQHAGNPRHCLGWLRCNYHTKHFKVDVTKQRQRRIDAENEACDVTMLSTCWQIGVRRRKVQRTCSW